MLVGLTAAAQAGQKLVIAEPVVPAAAPAWGVELAGTYNWGLNQLFKNNAMGKKNHVNTVGGDITGVYNIDENNAVTLRFGYGYGSDKYGVSFGEYIPGGTVRERLNAFTLMPGYRYTVALDEKWSVFGGVNVGLAANRLEVSETYHINERDTVTAKTHKSAWGFAWSAEVGAKYQINETVGVFVAGSYSGNTARPSLSYNGHSVGKMKTQGYLGVRAGVSFSF